MCLTIIGGIEMKRYDHTIIATSGVNNFKSGMLPVKSGEYVKYETAKLLMDALNMAAECYEDMELCKAALKLRELMALADYQ